MSKSCNPHHPGGVTLKAVDASFIFEVHSWSPFTITHLLFVNSPKNLVWPGTCCSVVKSSRTHLYSCPHMSRETAGRCTVLFWVGSKYSQSHQFPVSDGAIPQIWSCCLRSTGAGGRQPRWTALMGTDAATSGSPLAALGPSSQTPYRQTDRQTSAQNTKYIFGVFGEREDGRSTAFHLTLWFHMRVWWEGVREM